MDHNTPQKFNELSDKYWRVKEKTSELADEIRHLKQLAEFDDDDDITPAGFELALISARTKQMLNAASEITNVLDRSKSFIDDIDEQFN